MAHMYPSSLPDYIRQNPVRSAECSVYESLEKQLGDDFHVFYSSPWIGTTPDGTEIDGEADFTVAHADYGLLVIEVKGGRVRIEDDTRQWQSTNRHDITFRIKNPVEQARSGKHQLFKKLKNSKHWRSRYINIRHGVILCDSHRPARALGPDMPLKIFAFSEDIDRLDDWVLQRLHVDLIAENSSYNPLGKDGIEALVSLLSKGVELQVSLDRLFSQDKADIERLTEEQYFILNDLSENNRMAVAGAAGTGKTTLAVQKAIQVAGEGKQSLLVCFNELLAVFLAEKLKDIPYLTVSTFHRFCIKTAKVAGITLGHYRADVQYYNKTLPDLLFEALSMKNDIRFDAIIIDEGQDFLDNWYLVLECALKDIDSSIFYVFYDNNQQVQHQGWDFIANIPATRYRLSRNMRNTRHIFELGNRFYAGDPVKPAGPVGQPISLIPLPRNKDDFTLLKKQLGLLITKENIPAHHITILVSNKNTVDTIVRGGYIGKFEVSEGADSRSNCVTVETVRRFKGLDSPVVILFLPERYLDEVEMLYVAISRAQVKLIIIGEQSGMQFFKSRLTKIKQEESG